jgi:hypothetical protein
MLAGEIRTLSPGSLRLRGASGNVPCEPRNRLPSA